jgi:hypothetical protein
VKTSVLSPQGVEIDFTLPSRNLGEASFRRFGVAGRHEKTEGWSNAPLSARRGGLRDGVSSYLLLADDLGGDSLSGAIAGSLAKSAASSAGSYVFGKLLESAGIDLSGQDEMNAKLDQILQQLKQIENDLTALKKSLNLKFGQLDYDEVTNPIEPIISLNGALNIKNGALNIKYKNLASSTDLAEIRSLKEEIRTALYGPNDLDAAMETWHNSMCGFNGNTSIIKAWGVVVYNNNPLFGLAASQAIQKNWEWFDAQQAMTMNYLVERCNSSNLSRLVPEKMERWRAYRLDQLALLRGMVKTTDIHYSIDVQTQRASSYLTLLKVLPAGVLIDLETQVMWALNVGSPVRQDIFWNNQGKDNTSGQAMWAANSAVRPSGCTLGTSYATKTPPSIGSSSIRGSA